MNFQDVGYDEAMRRARALVPALRERARGAPRRRARCRGDGWRTSTAPASSASTSRGAGAAWSSTSWRSSTSPPSSAAAAPRPAGTSANLGVHHWMLALYDERAQDEVWGENPDALIASGIAFPQGTRAQGRRRLRRQRLLELLERRRPVGLEHAGGDGPRRRPRRRPPHVPGADSADYEIVDDWNVLGMRSTGSKSVRAKDVFVPEHRALCMYLARGGASFPGARVNRESRSTRCRSRRSARTAWPAPASATRRPRSSSPSRRSSERSTNYTGDAHARLPGRAAPRRRAPARRSMRRACVIRSDCLRGQESRPRGPHADDRGEAPLSSATSPTRCSSAPRRSTPSTRWPAPTASTTAIRSSASSATSTRSARTSASARRARARPWGLVALGGDFASPTL